MANKAEDAHLSKVVSLGCIVCLNLGYETPDVEIHHIGNGTTGKRATNYETIGLCHPHHRTGGYGVAVHSGRKEFERNFGTEQELLEQVKCLLSV